jgi:antitoxin (DNA-binding transcriptional repressor) of toxin-antitoxin stability system
MDDVAASGDTILITKRGKIVAKLAPVTDSRPQALGCLKANMAIIDEDFALPEWSVNPEKGQL